MSKEDDKKEEVSTEVAESWEKSTELTLPENFDELVEERALEIAHKYKEQSPEMKLFNEKKAQISFYKDQWALPKDDTVGMLMIKEQMGRQLGLSFMESMNGLGFINWKVAIYWEVLLSQLTKAWVEIKFSESKADTVTVEMKYQWNSWESTQTLAEWQERKIAPATKADKWYWTSPWTKYPETMLRYKAVRHVSKFLCPHLLGALPIMEDAYEVRATERLKDPETTWEELDDIVGQFEEK